MYMEAHGNGEECWELTDQAGVPDTRPDNAKVTLRILQIK